MYAKKSLGQNFLRSERALREIVNAGEVEAEDVVLEIGPGEGALTRNLLLLAAKVIAVEKDDQLYKLLKETFAKEIAEGRLDLIHDDILKFDPNLLQFYKNFTYKLVANIPYNLTGAILEKFLSADYQPHTAVFLLQKEVAARIVAKDKKESILSISIKVYGKPRYVETVKAGSFAPAPTVDSAILQITDISKKFFDPPGGGLDEKRFFELLKAGFQSKRKKLSSNLVSALASGSLGRRGSKLPHDPHCLKSSICDKTLVKTAFQTLNLDENTRAEDISVETWRKLAQLLENTPQ